MLPTRNYAGIDSAITQRPVSGAILGIDSEDRFNDLAVARGIGALAPEIVSPYSFTITKAQSILNGFFTRIGVTEVAFPWVLPNINLHTNQIQVQYQVIAPPGPVTTVTLQLPDGFYTPSQLAAAFQQSVRNIDASLAAFTMTYGAAAPLDPTAPPYASGVSASIPAFTYATNSANVEIAFLPMTPLSAAYPFPSYTRQLFDLMGFTTDIQSVLDVGPSYGGYTLCQACKYVDIVCTQITNNQSLKDNSSSIVNRDMLCRLYVADPTASSAIDPKSSTFCPAGCMPFTIYRNFATPKYIQWLPNQPVPGFLKFEVYSDDGSLLTSLDTNAQNGYDRVDWALTLLVSEN